VLPLLILAASTLLTSSCDRGDHPARIGAPAPPFTVSDADQPARTIDLAAYRGHIVILNFWATWCSPCLDELPSLLALEHRLPQVTVIAISQDEDPALYRQFLAENHVDLLTLRDPSLRIPHLYGTLKIPESYVIDRNGILRRKFVSAQNWTSPEILDYLGKL
jgi:thiol-disulfide isomerase/thioredoxin